MRGVRNYVNTLPVYKILEKRKNKIKKRTNNHDLKTRKVVNNSTLIGSE